MTISEQELERAAMALADGNAGMARVCARRAVAAAAREMEATIPALERLSAIGVLSWFKEEPGIPVEVVTAATMICRGLRDEIIGNAPAKDPVALARICIQYLTSL